MKTYSLLPLCPRCGVKLSSWTMSVFNIQEICTDCADDERQAPGFAAARAAENAAILGGDLHFPGVGLSEADRDFLAQRLKERQNA